MSFEKYSFSAFDLKVTGDLFNDNPHLTMQPTTLTCTSGYSTISALLSCELQSHMLRAKQIYMASFFPIKESDQL